jgi:hypothetical protein
MSTTDDATDGTTQSIEEAYREHREGIESLADRDGVVGDAAEVFREMAEEGR